MFRIPLTKPYLPAGTKERVSQVLDSGYLTEGPVTAEFEAAVRVYVGCGSAIAVTSCTTGLELALRALDIGPGDEVIVPDYTYPATADVVGIVGATIVLVDVTRDTMLIDYAALEQSITPRTKAVIPVSEFGNPLDHDRLGAIKNRHGILVVEDAACALGSEYGERKTGSLADISVFSFHPRKSITCGEGGMITTDNAEWAERMLSYKHFGMKATGDRLATEFVAVGTNYKLSNILAAVGVVQMEHIEEILDRRRKLAARYCEKLAGRAGRNVLLRNPSAAGSLTESRSELRASRSGTCKCSGRADGRRAVREKDTVLPASSPSVHGSGTGLQLPVTTPTGVHSYQTFCVLIEERNRVMEELRSEGIEVQIGTYALHHHPAFAESDGCRWCGSLENATYVAEHSLALPLFYEMTERDQDLVVDRLLSVIG